MTIVYGAASTGGGAQNFRVGYEITSFVDYSTGGAINSGTATASAEIQFYVRNAAAVSNDTQNFAYTSGTASMSGLTSNSITNTQTVATDRTIGGPRLVAFDYTTWGSSPGNFTGSITGSAFYVGSNCTQTWSIPIPARPGGVPSAPTSVTSTPGNATVSIGFGAPSTSDPAISLYQWSNDDVSWGTLTTNPFSEAGTNGTAKTVYVRAVNAAGAGPSASATSTPRTTPSAPASVTSTPNDGFVSIAFTAPSGTSPTNDGGESIDYYQYSTDNSNWSTLYANPFAVNGANGTAITVYVRAVNDAGGGAQNNATSTPRTVPSALSFSAAPINGNLTITYSAPSSNGGSAVTSYQYSTNAGSTWTTTPSNPFNVSGSNGTAITVYMRAVNAAGAGPATSVTETPRTVPSAPTSVASTPANGSISVSFGAPSSNGGSAVTGYEYSTNAGSTYTAVPSNTSPFTVSGTNGTAITVLVRATNAAGAGATASTSNTPRTVPSAPQSFAGDNTTFGQITLSWAAPSSNGGNAVSSYVLRTGATVLQNTSATSYVHTGLSAYTDYSYTVTAANAAGESTAASITVKSMGGVVNVWSGSAWVKVVPQVRNTANTAWVTGQARARNNSTSEWKYGT